MDNSIENDDLEASVINYILEDIDVTVRSQDIQVCHRLADKKRVIIKFVSRKTVNKALKNRKQLADIEKYRKKVYVNESLCGHYRYLFSKCKELWKQNKIHGFWVKNGSIKYTMS